MGVLDSIKGFVTDLLGSQQAQGGKPSGGSSDIFYDDPTKRIPGVGSQQPQGSVSPEPQAQPQVDAVVAEGVIDPANIPQSNQYRPMFNQGGGGAVSGGGGAIMATDRGGRYTAQGKDLGYEPLSQTGGKPMDEKLYTQLLLSANEPITNQDYYPEQNNIYKGSVSIDGMSAPIFAGSMGVTPMGAIDKLRRRDTLKQAMSKLMEDTQDAQLEFVPPDIRQAALAPVVATQFEAQANGLIQQLQSKYGKDWVKKARQDPETWKFVNNWKATEKAFNQGYDRAAEIIKLNNENQQKGNKMYLSDETLDTAKWLMTGVNEKAQGLPVNIGELALMTNRLEVSTNFDTWANEVLKNDKIMSQSIQQIPTAIEYQLQKDPTGGLDQEFQNQQKTFGAFPGGYRAYLMNKSIKQISEETARESIDTFDKSNPGAWKQMRNSESESKASVLSRMQSNFQKKLGTIMDAEIKTYTPPANTNININDNRGPKEGVDYFQKINATQESVLSGISGIIQTLNTENKTGQQRADLLKKSVKGLFRQYSDKGEVSNSYVGYEPIVVSGFTLDETPKTPESYKKFDAKTGRFVPMILEDFPGLAAGDAIESKPVINKLEVVAMTPDGQTFAWDSENIPANAELYVVKQMTLDYKKPANDIRGGKIPGKSTQVYDISPLSQSGEQLDMILQKQYRTSVAEGEEQQAFEFGK